jgi:hypothetical protein
MIGARALLQLTQPDRGLESNTHRTLPALNPQMSEKKSHGLNTDETQIRAKKWMIIALNQ